MGYNHTQKVCLKVYLYNVSNTIFIHSQGITLDKVVIDIGKTEMCAGLTYVALSRATKFEGIILHPMQSYARFQSITKKVIDQIDEINQLRLMADETKRQKGSQPIYHITSSFPDKCVSAMSKSLDTNVKANLVAVRKHAETSQCSGKLAIHGVYHLNLFNRS